MARNGRVPNTGELLPGLRAVRQERRLTQVELAWRAELTRVFVNRLERQRQKARRPAVRALAAALGVRAHVLTARPSSALPLSPPPTRVPPPAAAVSQRQRRRWERMAVHEAGHALAMLRHGVRFAHLWIGTPGTPGWTLAVTRQAPEDSVGLLYVPDDRVPLEIYLAGFAAEAAWGKRWPERRIRRSDDWGQAIWRARYATTGEAEWYVPREAEDHPPFVACIAPHRARVFGWMTEPAARAAVERLVRALWRPGAAAPAGEALSYERCRELVEEEPGLLAPRQRV